MIDVLVVDDDFRVARIHRAVVEAQPGFRVVAEAYTAGEAERLTAEHHPDLVLLDLYLPDGFGLDLVNRIRVAGGDCAFLVITAADDVETVERAQRIGAFGYLLKPFPLTELTQRLLEFRTHTAIPVTAPTADQPLIDRVFGRGGPGTPAPLPKGMSAETLALVRELLGSSPRVEWSAQACASEVGLSRVSARRYLEHLARQGQVTVTLRYGTPGRPERLFRWRG